MRKLKENVAINIIKKYGFVMASSYNGVNKITDFICEKCNHMWSTTAGNVMYGKSGCPSCYKNRSKKSIKYTHEYIKSKYAERNIDLLSDFYNTRTKNNLMCLICGNEWQASWYNFNTPSNKCGCPHCGLKKHNENDVRNHWLEADIKMMSGYKNASTPIYLMCLKCGNKWYANYHNYKTNHCGCPSCAFNTKRERMCRDVFEKKTGFDFPKKRMVPGSIRPLELDGYCDELKMAFEHNGKQHYEPIPFFGGENRWKKQIKNDSIKKHFCDKSGINLIIVSYKVSNIEKFIEEKINGSIRRKNSKR